jgi:8-oxo-dGTP pyrophosphatase MutT (NUDIX family)
MTEEKRNASMVGILRGDRILLCRTKKNPEFWQPVGGSEQGAEYPIETAMRELLEETGVELFDDEQLKQVCVHPSKTGGKVTFYTIGYYYVEDYVTEPASNLVDFLRDHDEIADDYVIDGWGQESKRPSVQWVSPREAIEELPMMPATKLFLWQLRYETLIEKMENFTKEVSDD